MQWRGPVAAIVLVLCLGPTQVATAASPTPGVATPADLSLVLVGPPSPDWVAAPNGTDGALNVGPLDLTSAAGGNDAANVRRELVRDGFTRGYVMAWVQRGTGALLVEIVEEFKTIAGARDDLAHVKFRVQIDTSFQGPFDISGVGDDAYGYRAINSSSSIELDQILFVKGNLLFSVAMVRNGQSSTGVVLGQAQKQYAAAPDETIDQTRQPTSASPRPFLAAVSRPNSVALVIVLGVGAVLAILVLLLVFVATRRGPPQAVAPATPLLSVDRRYWWDGSTWQDATVSVPDGAQRSPDGAYWFDGEAWRPVP